MGQIWNRIKRIAQSYSRDAEWLYESVEDEEQRRLKEIIDELNRQETSQQKKSSAGQQTHSSSQRKAHEQARSAPKPTGMTMESALHILGVASTASNEEIKRAYKKLMMKYHPDRVASMSAVEQEAAKRRAQEVNGAYQYIKTAKGL